MPPRDKDKEMKEVLRRMDHQDKQLEQLIWSIKGNPSLGIEGVMPAVKKVEHDVKELKNWRNEQTITQGKIDLRQVVKWVGGISTIVGCVVGVFELFRYVFR
jgi:hypothetical protein